MQSRRLKGVFQYFADYRRIVERIKEIVLKYDPEAEVYVFGSVPRGKYTALSDIDVLIVSDKKHLEYNIKVEVYRKFGDVPLELHYTDRNGLEKWYKRFIDSLEEI